MEKFPELGLIFLEIIIFLIHLIPVFLAARLVYLHYTNKLESKEIVKKIPLYTLQLLVAVSISMFVDSYTSLAIVKSKVNEISESTYRIEKQSEEIRSISESTNKVLINTSFKDEMTTVRKNFNPVLDSVFHDYIDGTISFFDQGINYGRITFQDNQRYKNAYILTLQYLNRNLKHPHMLATSLPDTSYFWSWRGDLKSTEKAIQEFTSKGGYLKRIFFVEPNFLNDSTVISILNRQVDSMNVDVRTIDINLVPREQQLFFVLNGEKELMWVSQINSKREITTTTFSTNYEQDMKPLFSAFAELESNSKKYEPIKTK